MLKRCICARSGGAPSRTSMRMGWLLYVARGELFMPNQALTLAHVHEDGVAAVHVLVGQRRLVVPVPQRQRDAVAAQLRGGSHTPGFETMSTARALDHSRPGGRRSPARAGCPCSAAGDREHTTEGSARLTLDFLAQGCRVCGPQQSWGPGTV